MNREIDAHCVHNIPMPERPQLVWVKLAQSPLSFFGFGNYFGTPGVLIFFSFLFYRTKEEEDDKNNGGK